MAAASSPNIIKGYSQISQYSPPNIIVDLRQCNS